MKKYISAASAPKAIGPYSQAVSAGNMIFCSGQIALDPLSAEIISGGAASETNQIMKNLKSVLEAAGASFKDVVKTTIYLVNMSDFAQVNEVYGSWFDGSFPARATIEVKGLPKGALVEIDAVAVLEKD